MAWMSMIRNPDLENTHAKGVAKNLVSVSIVAVADVCACYKEREGIVFFWIQKTPLHHLLDLIHSLFLVAEKQNSDCIRYHLVPNSLTEAQKQQ
jgi:hypothetical protein